MKRKKTFILKKKRRIQTLIQKLRIPKRQRFIVSIIILSLVFFFSENNFSEFGLYITIGLSLFTVLLFYLANLRDLKESFTFYILILPFLYTFSFGLFYFLVPDQFLSRMALSLLYAVGLYSLFLSHNIFTIGTMRAIGLLSSAKTVSFIITLISYFFVANVFFSLKWSIAPLVLLLFLLSFLFIAQSLWTVTLDNSLGKNLLWAFFLAICLAEISAILWFWPTTPTVIALFLTGLFYTFVGLAHVWFDRRLFKSVMWEYLWVAVIVFFILMLFTSWKA